MAFFFFLQNSFQYDFTDEGSEPEMLSRIAQTTAALTRLKPVWNDKSSSFNSKIRLMRSFVTYIFRYACESMTLTAELQRRVQAMDMRCYRKILRISYKDRVTNETSVSRSSRKSTTRRPPDDCKETQTAVVWIYLPFIRSGQNRLARNSESGKKTRHAEE